MQTNNNTNVGPLGQVDPIDPVGPVGQEEKKVYLCEKCGEYHTDDENDNEDDIFPNPQNENSMTDTNETVPVQQNVVISVVTSEDRQDSDQRKDPQEDDTECNLTEEVANPEQMIKDLNLSDH